MTTSKSYWLKNQDPRFTESSEAFKRWRRISDQSMTKKAPYTLCAINNESLINITWTPNSRSLQRSLPIFFISYDRPINRNLQFPTPVCAPASSAPRSQAIFRISMKLERLLFPAGLPTALCRLDPTKYALVNAALALNLRAGSYINIF